MTITKSDGSTETALDFTPSGPVIQFRRAPAEALMSVSDVVHAHNWPADLWHRPEVKAAAMGFDWNSCKAIGRAEPSLNSPAGIVEQTLSLREASAATGGYEAI